MRVVRYRSQRRVDLSSTGVLLTVIVCELEISVMRRPWPALGCCASERNNDNVLQLQSVTQKNLEIIIFYFYFNIINCVCGYTR
jgi:hypothetical protein